MNFWSRYIELQGRQNESNSVNHRFNRSGDFSRSFVSKKPLFRLALKRLKSLLQQIRDLLKLIFDGLPPCECLPFGYELAKNPP